MEVKPKLSSRSQKFSKTSRLKKKKDFRFVRFKRVKSQHFMVLLGSQGKGRLGISLSKRILKSSVARNRIRRLLREVFRKNLGCFEGRDINVLGLAGLSNNWRSLTYSDVEKEVLEILQGAKSIKND